MYEQNIIANNKGNISTLNASNDGREKNAPDPTIPDDNIRRSGRKRNSINYANIEIIDDFKSVTGQMTKRKYLKISKFEEYDTSIVNTEEEAANEKSFGSPKTKRKYTRNKLISPKLNSSIEGNEYFDEVTNQIVESNIKSLECLDDSVGERLNESGNKEELKKSRFTEESVQGRLIKLYCDRMLSEIILKKNENNEVNMKEVTENMAKCVVCKEYVEIKKFSTHKSKHNDIAWLEGREPLDLTNFAFILNVLTKFARRKKSLRCELCDDRKKSVVGFLTHFSVCKRSYEEMNAVKVKCNHCDEYFLVCSLPYHENTVHKNLVERKYNKHKPRAKENSSNSDDSSKRKAALKALSLLSQIKQHGGLVDETPEEEKKKKLSLICANYVFNDKNKSLSVKLSRELKLKTTTQCRFRNCNFEISDASEMIKHLNTCENRLEDNFTCKICVIPFPTFEEAENHVDASHFSWEVCDEQSDSEDYDYSSEDDIKASSFKLVYKNPLVPIFKSLPFLREFRFCKNSLPTYKWTEKFCQENYNIKNLFSNLRITTEDIEKIDVLKIKKYLPKSLNSMWVSHTYQNTYSLNIRADNLNWKKYKLFECELDNEGNSMIFCGGPIQSMAWLPTPYESNSSDQILAVAINSDPEHFCSLTRVCLNPGLIQFWNCGPLENKIDSLFKPYLQFCIAHDYGTVWSMEWCPSGCYDEEFFDEQNELCRIGLLAVATSDSNVYVYSVPKLNNSTKVVKIIPVLKLNPSKSRKNYHATRICWTKHKGHKCVVVGYSNGLVALFNIYDKENTVKDRTVFLSPYKIFQAHTASITVCSLYHASNGNRWLYTAGLDKSVKSWDLTNTTEPLMSYTKSNTIEAVWLNSWLGCAFAQDRYVTNNLFSTSFINFRQSETNNMVFLLYSHSAIRSVTGSDWCNLFLQGNNSGDLVGIFNNQIFSVFDERYLAKNRFTSSYSLLVERNNFENSTYIPAKIDLDLTYNDFYNNYGILFCDIFTDKVKSNLLKVPKDLQESPATAAYPINAVTKVLMNPNKQSFSYYACGYQSGFVKVNSLKFIRSHVK